MTPAKPKLARLDLAYQHCQHIARKHYENFPVASLVLPARLRKHVAAVYAFARQADDLADEGILSSEARLTALTNMATTLRECSEGKTTNDPVYLAITDTITIFKLPIMLFEDLISAFSQDVNKHRYHDFNELLEYCRRSANPVGRIMLHFHDQTDVTSLHQSDDICTALQLINLYQDLHQDYHESGRIYIPLNEMKDRGVTENHFAHDINDAALHDLMQLQYRRTSELLQRGAVLGNRLQGRFGLEIRLIIAGGKRILFKLQCQENCFNRPRLKLNDKLWMLYAALLP